MKVIYLSTLDKIVSDGPQSLAIGFFDGVHMGHQEVIKQAKINASKLDIGFSVMTFTPHPKEVLSSQKEHVSYLTPLSKKITLLEDLGVENLYVVTFDQSLAKMAPKKFVKHFLIALDVKHLVCGFDYTYGHMGKGNVKTLVEEGEGHFNLTVIEPFTDQEEKISSTRIRTLLADGRIEEANRLLTRPLTTKGKVVHGFKRGRDIGYPTANLAVDKNQALPRTGVYYVTAEFHGETVRGMANLGYNPTFEEDLTEVKLEVHFLDFKEDLYGETIEIYWQRFVRPELKFDHVQELIEKIKEDERIVRNLF